MRSKGVMLRVFMYIIMFTSIVTAADDAVRSALPEVLANTALRYGKDSYVIVPVHFTGCPTCVKIYLPGAKMLEKCSTKGYSLVFIAPVNRRVLWASANKAGSYPVKTIPDVQSKLTRAIGSSPEEQRALVVRGTYYRIVRYDINEICKAMEEL